MENKIKSSSIIKKVYWTVLKRKINGITSPFRVLPDFIIVGAMKSGTTSLYYNICQHPNIFEAAYDEIGFFDDNFDLGLNWYRSMFPTVFKKHIEKYKNKKFLTGEDTPFYFWKQNAVNRIFETLPNVKLIAILRNPVDRAYSNYTDVVKRGIKQETFEESIKKEMDHIEKFNLDTSNPFKQDNFLIEPGYLVKGLYEKQLELWTEVFPKKQIFICSTEELAEKPLEILYKIFEFLEVPKIRIQKPQKRKMKKYSQMNSKTRETLNEFFKPHNQQLFKKINQKFEWNI